MRMHIVFLSLFLLFILSVSGESDQKKEIQKLTRMIASLDRDLQSKKAYIQQLEEKIRHNESKEKQFLSKIEDMLKQNEILRNKMSSIHTQALKYQASSEQCEKDAEEYKKQIVEKENQIQLLENHIKFSTSSTTSSNSTAADCNCSVPSSNGDKDAMRDPRWEFGEYLYKEDLYNKEYIYDEQTEAENGPKDITLYCPVNPQLKITDLALDLVDKNICLYVANDNRHDWNDRQLQIGSPEIRSRLLLFCNGDIQSSQ